MEAAFFDLDKTVIAKASIAAFGRPFYRGGLINRRHILRMLFGQMLYLQFGASEDRLEKIRQSMLAITQGWEQAQVEQIVREALEDIVEPIAYAEAIELIAWHKSQNRQVYIVSASPEEIVHPLGAYLGVDGCIASKAEVDELGRYTGKLSFSAHGENKALAIRALAEVKNIDLHSSYAYTDSLTDLPMLEVVGHPVATNPEKGLAKLAKERGWPIVQFTHPVKMGTRYHGGKLPAIVAFGLVGVAGGAFWSWRYLQRQLAISHSSQLPGGSTALKWWGKPSVTSGSLHIGVPNKNLRHLLKHHLLLTTQARTTQTREEIKPLPPKHRVFRPVNKSLRVVRRPNPSAPMADIISTAIGAGTYGINRLRWNAIFSLRPNQDLPTVLGTRASSWFNSVLHGSHKVLP